MSLLGGRLGYLSGGPRVSTRPAAEAAGPRSHVLGFLGGCAELGIEVRPYIAGDRLPAFWSGRGSEKAISSGGARRLAADLARLALAAALPRAAWRELGGAVDWVYERYAAMQGLGAAFRRRGLPWILESNAPLSLESSSERRASTLDALSRRRERLAYEGCDALVCVSQALKALLIESFGLAPRKVLVMPNGVDPKRFDPERCRPKRLFPGLTVGFVGSLYRWQGLDLLLRALASLRADGVALSAAIVGSGPARAELEGLSRELGLGESVRFAGAASWEEVPSLMAGFDIAYAGHRAVLGTRVYFSPLKLYEYMAMARPVVASSGEDAARLLGGGAGWLFSPDSLDELRAALRAAAAAPQGLPEKGRRARAEILAGHSWSRRIEKMLAEAEELVSR